MSMSNLKTHGGDCFFGQSSGPLQRQIAVARRITRPFCRISFLSNHSGLLRQAFTQYHSSEKGITNRMV